ncbi:trypsin-like serine peptidase [Microtetraspora malaysiensis]|uniref:trypsin-like serine peptidase n=1 Tax=Microtetraspora malaysiensis TaxID=161358 RepID=UPI003D8F91FD
MKRTLAIGGTLTGLLAAGLVASPAQAGGYSVKETLAGTSQAAQQVAFFWSAQMLKQATPYNVETTVAAKHISSGGPSKSSKPGTVPAIGDEKKSSSKSKNVNLPKTTGKVFFLGADNQPHWCTATSLQSKYRNLVATAGHCVYDTESNKATLDKWVFVPGYYQGKTPWGIYVGKQAFTHYDYDVYEDGDRDYAFVTVYNGIQLAGDKEVDKKTYDAYTGDKQILSEEVSAAEFAAKYTEGGPYWKKALDPESVEVDPPADGHAKHDEYYTKGIDGIKLTAVEVDAKAYKAAPDGTTAMKNGEKCPNWCGHQSDAWTRISMIEYHKLKRDKNFLGDLKVARGKRYVEAYKKQYFLKRWIKTSTPEKYYKDHYYIRAVSNVGRLGDKVGGQGLAYNQKLGKNVYVFGYPSGSHPDGNHAYTGQTLKWSYGKTFAAKAPAIKAEELVAVKSSFTGEGSLGSAWLLNYKNNRRLGYLNGVTIAVADRDGNKRIDTSMSPYFDGETYGVYKQAANVWSGSIV